MRDLLILTIHLLVTCAKLSRPGGVRAVAAESLLLKHQILISNRSRLRAPNLTTLDRFVLGLTTLFIRPRRIPKLSALVATGTLLKFHKALVDREYRLLFSSTGHRRKPGPKGPCPELIAAIIALKSRNPKFGCVRIGQEIADAFGIELNKDGPLMLRHQLRFEAPRTVPWGLQFERTVATFDRLLRLAVATISRHSFSQMGVQLCFESCLDELFHQWRQNAVLARYPLTRLQGLKRCLKIKSFAHSSILLPVG